MECLPTEIIHSIFTHVDYADKRTCQYVSKSWHSMITANILYHTVTIETIPPTKELTLYETHQEIAKYVRDFRILGFCPLEKAFALPTLFPNLQSLYLGVTVNESEHHTDTSAISRISNWSASIQSIVEYNVSAPLFTTLWLQSSVKTGKLANLTTLDITMFDFDQFTKGIITYGSYLDRKIQFWSSLKHAITLRDLTLGSAFLTFQDVEEIHQNAPKIHSLSLKDVTLQLRNSINRPIANVPEAIRGCRFIVEQPAVALKNLYISLFVPCGFGHQDGRIIQHWLDYMTLKYTDLKSFTIQYDIFIRSTITDSYALNIVPMMASCTHLKVFKMTLNPISKDLLHAMDKNMVVLSTIELATTKDDMDQQLSLLSASNQAKHIKCLTIINDYEGGRVEYFRKRILPEKPEVFHDSLFAPLLNFSRLSSLRLDCTFGHSCEIAYVFQILNYCRSLEYLSLCHVSANETLFLSPKLLQGNYCLKHLTIAGLSIIRKSWSLVQTNVVLQKILEGLQNSLETLTIEFGSITIESKKVDGPFADYIHLDLSTLQQLRKLNVTYKLGSSTITTCKNNHSETYEFKHDNPPVEIKTPDFHYRTIVTLPSQAVKINSRLIL